MNTRVQELVADLVDELAHAERLIEEQAEGIETLEAEITQLRQALTPRTATA